MTRAFINGKEVRKEDIGKYEIKSEKIKWVLAEKLRVDSTEKKRA